MFAASFYWQNEIIDSPYEMLKYVLDYTGDDGLMNW